MQPFSNQQRLNLVNTEQLYSAWQEARATRDGYRYGMRWVTVKGREYLYRLRDARRNGKSLGPRSPETERLQSEFESGRKRSQVRLAELRAKLDEQARLNKALRINRVPRPVGRIIRQLDQHAASKEFRIVGTHALYAYEALAGVLFLSELLASGDVDLLYDPRKNLTIGSEKLLGKGLLGVLREADSSFRKMKGVGFRAVNDEGFMVDLIVPPRDMREAPLVQFADDDLAATEIQSLQWLANAPGLAVVAVAEDGWPVQLRVPDPRAFAIHKLWLSQQPEREPVKKPRDAEQARAVAELVVNFLPHLPFEKAQLRYLPERLVDDALQRLGLMRA